MLYDNFIDAIKNRCNTIASKLRLYDRKKKELTDEQKELFYDSLDAEERILFMSIFEEKIRKQDEALLNMNYRGKALSAWRNNYLILCGMDAECREECLKELTEDFEKGGSNYKKARFLAENLAAVLMDLARNYKYFEWEKEYCTVISSVWKALNYNVKFVEVMEYRLQKENIVFKSYHVAEKAYFDLLLEKEAYAAASEFLSRISMVDDFLSDMTVEEIKRTYLKISFPKFVWKLKELLAKRTDYSLKNLYEDIRCYNTSVELQKWVEVNYHIDNLKAIIVDGEASEESNEYVEYIQNNNIEMFDTGYDGYMTKLFKNYVAIFNYIIENGWNIDRFLDLTDSFNLFSHRYIAYTGGYSQYDEINRMSLISKLEEALFAIRNPEVLLKVYMNTHLKFCIEFNDVIRTVHTLVYNQYDNPHKVFEEIFARYIIPGMVVGVKNSKSNSLKLCPQFIYSRYNEKRYQDIPKKQEMMDKFFRGCIKSQENWTYGHKREVECLEVGNSCEFVIAGIGRGDILAKNIVQKDRNVKEKYDSLREAFADKIIAWLQEMQRRNEVLPWYDEDEYLKMSVECISDYGKREAVALEILRTLGALTDPQEIKKFCKLIGEQPCEEFNEFRHIKCQKYAKFRIRNREYLKEINELGWKVLSLENISSEDKAYIYKATCLKPHFWLEDAEKLLRDVLTIDAVMVNPGLEDKEAKVKYLCPVVPVVYAGRENGKPYFSTRDGYKNLVYKSKYKFVCDDMPDGWSEQKMLLRIKNVNHKERTFYCVYVDEEIEKRFDNIMRAIYDTKKQSISELSSDLKAQMAICKGMKYGISETVIFGHALEVAFRNQGNDINKCLEILDALKAVNPFLMPEYKSCEKREKHFFREEDMYETYQIFLEKYRKEKRGFTVMCELYFATFCKWLIPFEEFVADIGGQDVLRDVTEYLEKTYGYQEC